MTRKKFLFQDNKKEEKRLPPQPPTPSPLPKGNLNFEEDHGNIDTAPSTGTQMTHTVSLPWALVCVQCYIFDSDPFRFKHCIILSHKLDLES